MGSSNNLEYRHTFRGGPMAAQQSRIASLLNASPTNGTVRDASPAAASTSTSSGGSPQPTYHVQAGQGATDRQLGLDSSPGAVISVDGHTVAQGDDGLSLAVDQKGATDVWYSPPSDGTAPANGQTPATGQTSPAVTQTASQYTDPTQSGAQPAVAPFGSQTPRGTSQDGQSGLSDYTQVSAHASPWTGTGTGDHAGLQDSTQTSGGGSQTTAPGNGPTGTDTGAATYTDTGTAGTGTAGQDGQTQIQHLSAGDGNDAAKVDLAIHGATGGDTAPQMVLHDDGSYTLDYANGYGNGHDMHVLVKPDAKGGLDIEIPKGPDNPHEIKLHVKPDSHLDVNLTRDADGNFRIATHDHKQDQDGDWSGLKHPVGKDGKPVTDDGQHGTDAGDGQHGTGTGTGTGTGLGDGQLPTGTGNTAVPPADSTGTGTGAGAGPGLGNGIPIAANPGTGGGGTGGGGGLGGNQSQGRTGSQGDNTSEGSGSSKKTGQAAYDPAAFGEVHNYLKSKPVPKLMDMTTAAGDLKSEDGLSYAANHMGLGSTCRDLHDAIKEQLDTGRKHLSVWWTTNLNAQQTNNETANATSIENTVNSVET
ncbi:hypothetical protein NE235_03095 [Actinoallomurus spadix]|uniref:Uncharacterized protein n=1 Tax=Actinoallomurus spadix TaxID=79912 RepID=A0ABN0XL76_9ACTN|nr:hypothetical protein [Actinoallomurus spadix]MCO5985091.1 hypothetical protein [Actinoallomurus spadix]